MRLIYAPRVRNDFALLESRKEQGFLVNVIGILKAEQYPVGLFARIRVESKPWKELQREGYGIHLLKVLDPPSIYRVIYMVDDPHDVVYVMNVQHRSVDYKNATDIKDIYLDYFNNKRWRDG